MKVMKLEELDALPVFFIVGRGRSGSTLLRSMFDAHPQVMIPPESRFVQYLYYRHPVRGKWTAEAATRAIQDLRNGFEPLNVQADPLFRTIEKHDRELNLERVCKMIYLHSPTGFDKDRIRMLGDKNPRYSFFIPQLMKIFPGARFIHLVRDYRDNLVSIRRAGKIIHESGNWYYSMGRWSLYNRAVYRSQQKDPERFCRVQFEDLVRKPEATLKTLCRFLGLDYDPAMLNYRQGLGNFMEQEAFQVLHRSLESPPDPSKIGAWRHDLPERTAIRCEVLGGRLPEKIGYPPEFRVNLIRKTGIRLLYFPLILTGRLRYLPKIWLYRCRPFMRIAYGILMKLK